MKIAYNFTAGEGRGPEMCSGCRVCLVTQPYMLSSCVPWKVRPESTKQTIYAGNGYAGLRLRTTRRTKGSAHIAHALELTENGKKNGIDFLI